jgi:hypothetical protein
MALCKAFHIGAKLAEVLGLPKNVKWMELRVAANETVSVKCEYLPEDVDGNLLKAVFAEYELTEKKTASLSYADGDRQYDIDPEGIAVGPKPQTQIDAIGIDGCKATTERRVRDW